MPNPIIICINLLGFSLALTPIFSRVDYKFHFRLGKELQGVTVDLVDRLAYSLNRPTKVVFNLSSLGLARLPKQGQTGTDNYRIRQPAPNSAARDAPYVSLLASLLFFLQ